MSDNSVNVSISPSKIFDDFIQNYLLTLQDPIKVNFVNAELKVNGALVAYAEGSFKASLKELSGLVRGRKALKKYK